ncbi:UDP-3-O-acyl-N-acetylglucosamine deacetylase [Gammaproteobacteria bacterium]|jgi:UDP-3-O-[3-hydroxymyristoyl] N-acetylglucosamine deacetylase|nr:UDP-3-O-acyl-N-acetylglucosamine deacetylase [Gammaproteobacteria bacterium]MDA9804932.1 UDP-3-O-acyl-N-acetylglucosamine deacetylase [Gammaproteobacteria bacterium]MDC0962008.1 UDP-3-O-acyl-N-acetylglucosamine deacetylase [Gammaproteobacteria bacterium]MDC1007549.1 UDP-3-O-acyl-N-acetylglucosamine deacetylase [Gammaproteobacteria bacterium]MDC3268303.1 UDP-3-O-acyl-N-acetylglucosamine deacetylase [Gammaproteobacteria bacterium]
MLKQRTLRNPIKAVGIGLHTGKNITMELLPADINTGINFIRNDVDEALLIPAIAENVGDTSLSTALIKDDIKISTIEHLLSAIAGLGVDNCIIKVDGPEVPIMDGSSSPFVFLIQSAGLEDQNALKKFIKVKKEITVTRDDAYASIKPFNGFKVSFKVDFDHPVHKTLPSESIIDFSSTSFVKEVCRARTFGSWNEKELLQSKNLALGASVSNAIVFGKEKILNEEGLRFNDEIVKHKMLDAIGDLYLLGGNLIGQFSGYKSGHALNNQLLRKIISDSDAYEVVEFENSENAPISYVRPPFGDID